jgi:UDP-2-acetamido-2,6-beta-L-arabino-hexul-4-ose reductase
MVVGRGLIARAFMEKYSADDKVLIFASGVSHSKDLDLAQFAREQTLLLQHLKNHPTKFVVYFGTCSVYDPSEVDSPYVQHKLAMEDLVRERSAGCLICRVSNVVGHTDNKTTIFNFLVNQIDKELPFNLWKNAVRNLIDIDDVSRIVGARVRMAKKSAKYEMNVANPESYPVTRIVEEIEKFSGKKARYHLVDAGSSFHIDTNEVEEMSSVTHTDFRGNYLNRLLQKYYTVSIQSGVL